VFDTSFLHRYLTRLRFLRIFVSFGRATRKVDYSDAGA
jgi:hypothetical protein